MQLLLQERIAGLSMNRVFRDVIKLTIPPGEAGLEVLDRAYGRLFNLPDHRRPVQ